MDRLYMPCFSLIVLCVSRHRFQRIPQQRTCSEICQKLIHEEDNGLHFVTDTS